MFCFRSKKRIDIKYTPEGSWYRNFIMFLEWLKNKKGLVLDKIGCLHMVGFRSRSFLGKRGK